MANQHVVVVDFDGTLVEEKWPKRPTELLPGAHRAMCQLRDAGVHLTVWSARLAPVDPWGKDRDFQEELDWMRGFLDAHGLDFVDIHTRPWKPGATVYIDDKAVPFDGSWARAANKTLARLKQTRPRFPALPGSVEESHAGDRGIQGATAASE